MDLTSVTPISRFPVRPDAADLPPLRRWNLLAMLAHAVSGGVLVALANDFSLPVTASWQRGAPGTADSWPTEHLFGIPGVVLAAGFAFLSALAHLVVATVGWQRYCADLRDGINRFRWVEYSLSSSVMIVAISMLVGITDFATLVALAGVNASMILFGWAFEVHNRDRRGVTRHAGVAWSSYWFGCAAGAIPWLCIFGYAIGAPEVPGFVWGILASLFVFFNCFGLVPLLEYGRRGPFARVAFTERAYILLSLTAKVALTWQIGANVLID